MTPKQEADLGKPRTMKAPDGAIHDEKPTCVYNRCKPIEAAAPPAPLTGNCQKGIDRNAPLPTMSAILAGQAAPPLLMNRLYLEFWHAAAYEIILWAKDVPDDDASVSTLAESLQRKFTRKEFMAAAERPADDPPPL